MYALRGCVVSLDQMAALLGAKIDKVRAWQRRAVEAEILATKLIAAAAALCDKIDQARFINDDETGDNAVWIIDIQPELSATEALLMTGREVR